MKFKNIFRSAAAAALAMSAPAFAFASGRDHIIGGEKVRPGDPIISSTVLIMVQLDGSKDICGGSLIARDTIVTAAHCVAMDIKAPTDPEKISLVFGLTMPMSAAAAKRAPTIHGVKYVYDPGWKGVVDSKEQGEGERHDIAVILFDGELPEGYAPAALLDPSVSLKAGTDVTLAGYGVDAVDAGSEGAGTLRKVSGIPVLKALGQTEVVLDQKAGAGGCQGDSGGPAFLMVNGENYLWGVTSRGDDDCKTGIYTRIAAYYDFISRSQNSLRSQNQNAGASAADSGRQHQASERTLHAAGAAGAALSVQ